MKARMPTSVVRKKNQVQVTTVRHCGMVGPNLGGTRIKTSKLFHLASTNVNKRANLQDTVDKNDRFLDIVYFVCRFGKNKFEVQATSLFMLHKSMHLYYLRLI